MQVGKKTDIFLQNILIDLQSQLQTQVLKKISLLKEELSEWERAFMANNSMSAPSHNDYLGDDYIAGINRKIRVGNQLLKKWDINF